MELRVLGSCGGIMSGNPTTSFLLDSGLLLDGGTGIGTLEIAEMCAIDQVLLTHAHLDHVSGIGLMLATVIGQRKSPIEVFAPSDVVEVLRTHLFNWSLWPDFSVLPSTAEPLLKWVEVQPEQPFELNRGLTAEAVALNHTVPSYAYIIRREEKSFCFCGDTGRTERLWERLNEEDGLTDLFIELSYPSEYIEIARVSGHHCVTSLLSDLEKLNGRVQINLMHHKPGYQQQIWKELEQRSTEASLIFAHADPGGRFTLL